MHFIKTMAKKAKDNAVATVTATAKGSKTASGFVANVINFLFRLNKGENGYIKGASVAYNETAKLGVVAKLPDGVCKNFIERIRRDHNGAYPNGKQFGFVEICDRIVKADNLDGFLKFVLDKDGEIQKLTNAGRQQRYASFSRRIVRAFEPIAGTLKDGVQLSNGDMFLIVKETASMYARNVNRYSPPVKKAVAEKAERVARAKETAKSIAKTAKKTERKAKVVKPDAVAPVAQA